MIYKTFQDKQLSALGMGAMRLPVIGGDDTQIDEKATEEMVAYAMAHGINYYDTAWAYHGEQSEIVLGKVLSAYSREEFYLATKFPGYDLSNIPKVEEIFEKQLEKCRVDYFDFYLFHNVNEMNLDAYLDPQYGIYDYLMKQKKEGRIRHLGFSAHGHYNTIKRFLEVYGQDMEFGQLQLNWVDWTFQNGREKVELLREYDIPVWVMEPLRGGRLAKLPEAEEGRLRSLRPEEDTPAWAFRFLQSIPEVAVVLSGMSNFEQLKENIETFANEKPLDQGEMNTLFGIADDFLGNTLPCTGCNYCVSHCPQKLNVPYLITHYNEAVIAKQKYAPMLTLRKTPKESLPFACLGCGACEEVCPQQIKISEAMSDFSSRLKPFFAE